MKNNIKQLREEMTLTQKECADKFGVTLRAWQTYEQGVSEPKYELLCKIADMFNVSLDYLLGRTPVKAMATLAEDEPTEEEIKQLETQIIASYTQMSIETRRESIKILMQIVGDVFSDGIEDEDSTEEPSASGSTA